MPYIPRVPTTLLLRDPLRTHACAHASGIPGTNLAHTWHPGGDGRLCVADFGLVRYHQSDEVAEMTAETGSYRWMAPEVIRR